MPLAANDATDRVEQLIILTERLTGLIERETELLKDRRPHEIQDFQDERAKLSTLYVQEMELVNRNTAMIEGAPKSMTDELKQRTETFQDKLADHARILTRVRTITEGVVKAIAEETSRKNEVQSGYGGNGQARTTQRRQHVPLAVHEVI